MWSHQPAGRPVIGITSLPAARSRSAPHRRRRSAGRASSACRRCRCSTPRIAPRARPRGIAASGCMAARRGHARGDAPCATYAATRARCVGGGHPQAALGPPPQDVVGGARPLFAHQVVDLGAVSPSPKSSPRSAAPSPMPSTCGAREPCRRASRATQLGAAARGSARCSSATHAAMPAGGRSPPGSTSLAVHRRLHRREVRLQLGERVLGELAVGGDLAAEDRQHRRARPGASPVSSLNT